MAQLAHAPFQSARHTIEFRRRHQQCRSRRHGARDEAVAQGVTINGLVIFNEQPMSWDPDHTNPPGGLANYYRNNVIGGAGAFVMVAEELNSFGQAILSKMIAEVAQAREPLPRQASAR